MLTCSCCASQYSAANNGDSISPCCNAEAIESMSLANLKEALIEAIVVRAIDARVQ